jgi:hypothetical protein
MFLEQGLDGIAFGFLSVNNGATDILLLLLLIIGTREHFSVGVWHVASGAARSSRFLLFGALAGDLDFATRLSSLRRRRRISGCIIIVC